MATLTRRKKLRALAEAHDAWVEQHLTDVSTEFEPRETGSDYNIHNVDVDADGAAEDEFAAATAEIFRRSNGDVITANYAFRWLESDHPRDAGGQFTESYGAFDFLDDADLMAMHGEMQGDDPWTETQVTSLGDYAALDYREMNGLQRGTEEIPGPARETVERQIANVRSAMRPTTRDIRVSRFVQPDAFGLELRAGDVDYTSELKPLLGRTFEEPGFFSTSADSAWLDRYKGYHDGIQIEIDVPTGTRAAYLAASEGPGVKGERELLLDAGTRFRLVEIRKDPNRSTYVRLQVIS